MKNIFKYILVSFLFITNLYSAQETKESIDKSTKITELQNELRDVNKELEKNIWITRYNNYLTYRK